METNVKAIELRDLWRRYKATGDDKARERLVVAYSPLVKYVAGRMASGPARARRGVRPHLVRPRRPDQRDRALRARARHQVRDLRDHPHQGRDHRRAALAGLGAALRALPRPRDREGQLQARAPAPARAHRRGDGRRARDDRRRVPGGAAPDLQLDRRRARRAVDGLGRQRRPGLAARHAAGPRRARPVARSWTRRT